MKALGIISENEKLKEPCTFIHERKRQLKQELTFIEKQKENALKKFKDECEPYWDEIKEVVKNKLPEDYSDEKYNLTFNIEEDVLKLEDMQDGIPAFFKMLGFNPTEH